jgi:hypothetical protein
MNKDGFEIALLTFSGTACLHMPIAYHGGISLISVFPVSVIKHEDAKGESIAGVKALIYGMMALRIPQRRCRSQ